MKKIELLAPAGNMDSLKAAIMGGCDAVYLGGKHFDEIIKKLFLKKLEEEYGSGAKSKLIIKGTDAENVRKRKRIFNLLFLLMLKRFQKFAV